ncbi:MAG: thiamine pyrophosphate-binding protein [Spirochaetaceae bacterium]|nr:thiamine pyrophosphate-binding protein [Spirochaetaceae bacterium]
MKASDYIVNFLIDKGVADVFGIPGGVVLDFLDSVGKRKGEIAAHLNYNEQASAFAACGYAQIAGKLAAAYATRGPGITNMVTGITNAFCESLPIFFITAHSHKSFLSDIRIEEEQEFDTIKMLSSVTKYAVKIENVESVRYEIEKACYFALNERPGPVLIDFLLSVLRADIDPKSQRPFIPEQDINDGQMSAKMIANCLKQELSKAKRPAVLIGNGIRQSGMSKYVERLIKKWNIPVLSSRSAQDIIPDSKNYYGYIGSHGIRYSNFILSKCDLLISLGNRLMFKPSSKTFGVITDRAKIIRIDVDKNEFLREIPNSVCFAADLRAVIPLLVDADIEWQDSTEWGSVCKKTKETLYANDSDFPVNVIVKVIKSVGSQTVITSDVGNNEFLLSRAYTLSGATNRILYSKSFGPLGISMPKAIGAFYSTKSKVLCFTGDQGLQMNIQELQFIVKENLPIVIVVLNNFSSGMIRDQQEKKFDSRFLCTTLNDGYSVPNIEKVATAFGMGYHRCDNKTDINALKSMLGDDGPVIIEILVDKTEEIIPHLPVGYPMQNIAPEIDGVLYERLERM